MSQTEEPQIQEDPILMQYEALKAELGLTDEEVQALKESRSAVVHKVNKVLGSDEEKKAAKLIELGDEKIKIIKAKFRKIKKIILKWEKTHWHSSKERARNIRKDYNAVMNCCGNDIVQWNIVEKYCDSQFQNGDMRETDGYFDKSIKKESFFEDLLSLLHIVSNSDSKENKKKQFSELMSNPEDWKKIRKLIQAKNVYGINDERFYMCVNVLNVNDLYDDGNLQHGGLGRLDALIKAQEIYRNDNELFEMFAILVTKDMHTSLIDSAVESLIECKHLFIHDKELTKKYIKMIENDYLGYSKEGITVVLKTLDEGKKMCDENNKNFEELLDILQKAKRPLGPEDLPLIVEAFEKYGDDKEKFARFIEIGDKFFTYDQERTGAIKTLQKVAEIFPDDDNKFHTFADLIEESNYYPAALLLELRNLYEKDEEKFEELSAKMKGTFAEAIRWIFEKDLFQHINGSEVRFDAYIKLFEQLRYSDSSSNEKSIHYALSTASDEMLHEFTKHKALGILIPLFECKEEVYDNDIKRLEYTATYLYKKYIRDTKAIKIFVDLAEQQSSADNVDMKQVGEIYVEQVMQSENWVNSIVEIYKNEELREFMPEYLRDFFGVIAQVNINALSSKLNSHFKPFNFDGATMADKLKVLHIYGEFLTEFNGTMVPTVWHLYYLLKDPLHAKEYLTNIKELNNTRELEQIATLDDLHNQIYDLKEGILLGSVDLKHLQRSDLALAVLDDMAKVSASEWKREGRSLPAIVGAFERDERKVNKQFKGHVYKNGFIPVREITEPFRRDEALDENVSKVQTQTKEMFESEAAAISRYKNQLEESIRLAITKAQTALDNGVDGKGETLSEKAKVFAFKKIKNFNELQDKLSEVDNLEDLLHLCLSKEASELEKESVIRGIFYYLAAKKQGLDQDSWLYFDPRQVDASTLLEFIEDTILFEVIQGKSSEVGPMVKLTKKEKKAVKREFASLLNFLKQKNTEEAAYKEKAASSTKNIAVVAGRGLLAELSGFYCDACWTSRSDILKNNPTMVGHTMVENFEQKEKSKIIGGCLTLESSIKETDEETGKENNAKVLVVRGLNPQQQYLKKYDVAAFVESFLDYVQEAGRKAGAEYIVLPLHNTGALSNRPEVINYLQKKYTEQERVSLNDDIEFNGYKIKDACAVVRTISVNKRQGKLPKPSNVPLEQQEAWIGSW